MQDVLKIKNSTKEKQESMCTIPHIEKTSLFTLRSWRCLPEWMERDREIGRDREGDKKGKRQGDPSLSALFTSQKN